MDMAEAMLTTVAPVAAPAIVDTPSLQAGQDANGIQGVFAALGMHCVTGQRSRSAHVHPLACACDGQAGFLDGAPLPASGLFDLLLDRLQDAGRTLHLRGDRRFRLFQRQQFCHQAFERGIFFSKSLQFFFLRHDPTVVRFNGFGKSLGVLNSYTLRS